MRKSFIAAGVAAFLTAIPLAGIAGATGDRDSSCGSRGNRDRLEIVGLIADQRLTCFREDRPERARTIGKVSGLDGDTALVGIDVRPANGKLYGVGDKGGIYTVDPGSATAKLVVRAIDVTTRQPIVLQGASFGTDFNPPPTGSAS